MYCDLKNVEEFYLQNKNKISQMYHTVKVPKKSGKLRTLEIPNSTLDGYQQKIKEYLTASEGCSAFAAAYQCGKDIKSVAHIHTNKKLILKLDIKDFFGHITTDLIRNKVVSFAKDGILAQMCSYNGHLPQGACTSPVISNLVMKDFDYELGRFCTEYGINFSRYSDDMIFSGDFNPGVVIRKVKFLLDKMNMKINKKKTVIAGRGSQQMVLGIVVNEKLQLSSDYRRKLRQEVYFCNKYGARDHIVKSKNEKYIIRNEQNNVLYVDTIGYIKSLAGKLAYARHINPQDTNIVKYTEMIYRQMT